MCLVVKSLGKTGGKKQTLCKISWLNGEYPQFFFCQHSIFKGPDCCFHLG